MGFLLHHGNHGSLLVAMAACDESLYLVTRFVLHLARLPCRARELPELLSHLLSTEVFLDTWECRPVCWVKRNDLTRC